MKLVIISVILSIVLSIFLDTILLEGKKDVRIVFKKIKEDKKYLFINLLNIIIVGFMASIMEYGPHTIILLSLIFIFYKIVVIDIKDKVINIKLFIVMLIISLLSLVTDNGEPFLNSILTGVCLFVLFWIIAKVTREALGKGDAMVIGSLGLVFGLQGMCGILLVASLITCFISIIFLVKSFSNKNKSLAFTPFIYLAMLLLIFLNNY